MVLLIDNYDSFTYNLYQYFSQIEKDVVVVRNDKIDSTGVIQLNPDLVVISPGPGTPLNSGNSIEIVKSIKNSIPILGICLGLQVIAHVFGARIIRAKRPMHGKLSKIYHNGEGVFSGLKNPLNVTRYHSLIVDQDSLSTDLQITAITEDNEIMGVKHKNLAIQGVQFHPEALLTECGFQLLKNFFHSVVNETN